MSTHDYPRAQGGCRGFHVRIFGDGVFATRALPSSGLVVIGRGLDADIRVAHASLSRKHATLHLGPRLLVEDLGSANGTWVGGRRLDAGERAEISDGQVVEMGSEVMLVVRHEPGGARSRRVWTHSYFESRLEKECTRARPARRRFTLVAVHLDGESAAGTVDAIIEESLPAKVWIGEYAPGKYEILLLDVERRDAEQIAGELGSRLTSAGARVRLGYASYPVDGADSQLLVATALAMASGSGGQTPVVVRGAAMAPIFQLVDRVAPGGISVLLLGETGVGKEVLARAIHERSPRSRQPLVVFDCAAVAPNLIESELFGHVKGAFTGANENRDGAFVQADGGTLFLDEIGELALDLQPKLLRVLEQHAVRPVGGGKAVPVDVRVIAATHRSLEREVTRGAFREDLYYRLNGISIEVPPLRERRDEIAPLAAAFLAEASRKATRVAVPRLSLAAEELLRAYAWPGNVRELLNAMERALLLCDGERIEPEHLPLDKMKASVARLSIGAAANLAAQIDALEQERILEALAQCGGNQSRTARQLGISRKMLLGRLDAYGVRRPRKRS